MKIRHILFSVTLLFAAFVTSCQDDDIVRRGADKTLRFIISTQDETVVNTRTNNDKTLSDVYVLLFHTDNTNPNLTDADYTFVGAASATTTDTEANGYRIYFADVNEQTSQSANKFCIAANTGSSVSGNLDKWKSGATLETIKKDMKVTLLMQSGYIIEEPRIAPMCSPLQEYKGMDQGDYQVDLERATAKFTVTVSETDADAKPVNVRYKLSGISLGNISTEGYVFGGMSLGAIAKANYAGKSGSSYSPEYMMGDALADAKQSEPVYAFPTAAVQKPFVIIKGTYDGIEGYHRINLYSNRTTKEFYPVNRNYHYMVNIGKITTVGYATAQEAIDDEDGSNADLNVDITVNDGTSRDIITNGEYYLGLSNSELIIYSSEDLTDVHVATIQYDKTAAAAAKVSISYTTTEGSGNATYNTDVLTNATTNGELIASIPKEVMKGEFLVRIGELAKRIKIERRMDGLSLGGTFTLKSDKLVYGKVVSATSGTAWIKMSTDETPNFNTATDEFFNPGTGKLKVSLVLANNLVLDAAASNTARTAELTVTKADDEGHSKILIYQPVFDIFDKGEVTTGKIENPYVGAFWRASQMGERVIKMAVTGVTGDVNLLTWEAVVAVGSDWAGVQLGGSSDLTKDAENFPVAEADMKMSIQGTGLNPIFRIGVKSKIAADEHRYGLVLVSTYLSGKLLNRYKIFLRQGDTPDYLFRDGDGGYGNSVRREKAVKLCPYNLSDPLLGKGTNLLNVGSGNYVDVYSKHNAMPLDYFNSTATDPADEFTEYPTQPGYLFIWNIDPDRSLRTPFFMSNNPGIKTSAECMRAIHPLNNNALNYVMYLEDNNSAINPGFNWNTNEIPLVFNKKGDPCPKGYRMPSVGTIVQGNATLTDAVYSELVQSLLYNQTAVGNPGAATTMSQYTLWGYYADGFFDRLNVNQNSLRVANNRVNINEKTVVLKGATGNETNYNTDALTGNDIGYVGMVIFNPYNLASLFFPASGYMSYGSLISTGTSFAIWTTERLSTASTLGTVNPMDMSGSKLKFDVISGQGTGGQPRTVRCVQLRNGEVYP